MNRRQIVLSAALAMVVFSGIASAAYIHNTIAQYNGAAPCGKRPGLVGMLQATNFLPQGDCKLKIKGDTATCANHGTCQAQIPNTTATQQGWCSDDTTTAGGGCVCVTDPQQHPNQPHGE
jgi:hypothetical protein